MAKILFTGTIGSGKAAIVNQLQSHSLPNYHYIEGIAEQVLLEEVRRTHDPHIDQTADFQDRLFERQLEAEISAEKKQPKILFCHRGEPDNIAHTLLFGIPIKQEWIHWSQSYDKVFLFSKEGLAFQPPPLQKDVVERDWQLFRNCLEICIRRALHLCHLPYEVVSGDMDERLKTITRAVDRLSESSSHSLPRKNL